MRTTGFRDWHLGILLVDGASAIGIKLSPAGDVDGRTRLDEPSS